MEGFFNFLQDNKMMEAQDIKHLVINLVFSASIRQYYHVNDQLSTTKLVIENFSNNKTANKFMQELRDYCKSRLATNRLPKLEQLYLDLDESKMGIEAMINIYNITCYYLFKEDKILYRRGS